MSLGPRPGLRSLRCPRARTAARSPSTTRPRGRSARHARADSPAPRRAGAPSTPPLLIIPRRVSERSPFRSLPYTERISAAVASSAGTAAPASGARRPHAIRRLGSRSSASSRSARLGRPGRPSLEEAGDAVDDHVPELAFDGGCHDLAFRRPAPRGPPARRPDRGMRTASEAERTPP